MEGSYTFAGIHEVEAQDRYNEHRTGVPGSGVGFASLFAAPVKRTTSVRCVNTSEHDCEVRLRHGSLTRAQSGERLTGMAQGGGTTIYIGRLQFGSIVPGTVVVTVPGAPADLEDNVDDPGKLFDVGTSTQRGTIDYVTGSIAITFGAAATEPVTIAYSHNAPTDFASPVQTTNQAAGGFSFVVTLGFGRVNPGSVAMVDGNPLTFVDDGKGNIIETTGGISVKRGTIDYGRGIITLTGASLPLAGTVATAYRFNPFAAIISKGAGSVERTLYPGDIPELSDEPWADGVKDETEVFLVGLGRDQSGAALITRWAHWGEEPYRVRAIFSSFPPGGHSNDPSVRTITN